MKLVNADTLALGREIQLDVGVNELTLHIAALHLNPGDYMLGWWIANHPTELFDFCESAMTLNVADLQDRQLGYRPSSDGVVTCTFDLIGLKSNVG